MYEPKTLDIIVSFILSPFVLTGVFMVSFVLLIGVRLCDFYGWVKTIF